MTKTLNQLIFFPPPKSEYFFQQHWESEYFLGKNHTPPFKLKGRSLSSTKVKNTSFVTPVYVQQRVAICNYTAFCRHRTGFSHNLSTLFVHAKYFCLCRFLNVVWLSVHGFAYVCMRDHLFPKSLNICIVSRR